VAKVRKGFTRSQHSQFIQHLAAKLGLSFLEGFLGVFSADFGESNNF